MASASEMYFPSSVYNAITRSGHCAVGLGTSIVSIGQPNARKVKTTAPSRQLWVMPSKVGWSNILPAKNNASALSASVFFVGQVGQNRGGGRNESCSPLAPDAWKVVGAFFMLPPPQDGRAVHLPASMLCVHQICAVWVYDQFVHVATLWLGYSRRAQPPRVDVFAPRWAKIESLQSLVALRG